MYHQNGAIIHTQSQRRFHRWQFYLLELKFLMTIIFFILIKCFLTLRKQFSIYQPRTLRESSKNHWYCYLYLQNAFPVSVHVLISKMCDIFTAKHPANSVTFYRASITLTSCERTVIYHVMFFAVIFISWNAVKILLYVLVISNLLFPDTQIINLSHSTDDHCCRIAKVSSCKSRNCQQPIKLCKTLISQHRVQCQILPTHFA